MLPRLFFFFFFFFTSNEIPKGSSKANKERLRCWGFGGRLVQKFFCLFFSSFSTMMEEDERASERVCV